MQGSARKKILEAASDLFEHHGYYHVTTKDIARKARVNEATVFRLFGSKKELGRAVAKSAVAWFDRKPSRDARSQCCV